MYTKSSVQDFLAHYKSAFYDPVKAHEYYERTKDLKGKRSATNLNNKGKEVWSYTKEQITQKKKTALQNEEKKKQISVENAQKSAKLVQEQITSKLKAFVASLTGDKTSRTNQRAIMTAQIAQERAATRMSLKSVVENLRKNYATSREKIKTQYEDTYQKEYNSILKENSVVKKRPKKKS